MKVLYVRISSIDQNSDRQRVNEKDYDFVVEDKCSGSIPFFERVGGKEILKLYNKGVLTSLHVWQIDRIGRDLRDILNTIHFFTVNKITIHFECQGLSTLDKDGNENAIAKMMIAILGTVGEMEKNLILERQREGIAIAKLQGKYLGRKVGSDEDSLMFLSKPKNKKAIEYLKKGYKAIEVAKITNLSLNTLTKIKKLSKVI
jgi:DNA invertase Pin-like site-specific DNA recombinase